MKDTEIYAALLRLTKDSYEGRAEFMLTEVFKFEEGVWVTPNNRQGNDYTIFVELEEIGLVVKKLEPVWNKGSYLGKKICFMYKKNLKYQY